ncbi:hypothetical protein SDC9_158869 [bioreactor metagenome]|uniref:Uncharacterized protein n=1 Tax=bioreactor metagenome TaxID=1076179 RepID=A0A645FDA9_9ZZZZ
MPAHRFENGFVATAIAVQVKEHRARAAVEFQCRHRTCIGEKRVAIAAGFISHQQQCLFHTACRDHAADQMQTKRVARAAQVHVKRNGGLGQAQTVLQNDGGGWDQVVRRLGDDDQRTDFFALPLQIFQELFGSGERQV